MGNDKVSNDGMKHYGMDHDAMDHGTNAPPRRDNEGQGT